MEAINDILHPKVLACDIYVMRLLPNTGFNQGGTVFGKRSYEICYTAIIDYLRGTIPTVLIITLV